MIQSIHVVWINNDYCLHSDDGNGLIRWRSYPNVDPKHVTILQWFIHHSDYVPELFHFNNHWLHVLYNGKHWLMLVSDDFYPQTYLKLLKQFAEEKQFQKIVEIFVEFSIQDKIDNDLKIIKTDRDILSGSGVKSLVKLFGLDIILVYTAILLRKRIFVYDHSFSSILNFLSALIGLHYQLKDEIIENFYPNLDSLCSLQCDNLKGMFLILNFQKKILNIPFFLNR